MDFGCNMSFAVLVLFATLGYSVKSNEALPCAPRDFGQGSVVCVCNTTYCDSVEPNEKVKDGFSVYTSTKSGLRLARSEDVFSSKINSTDGVMITVNRSERFQSIIGFGGAFTDAAGFNIASLPPTAVNHLLNSYFSPSGIEYTVGRIPMASCDFSTHVYSYDDSPGDFSLTNFTLAPEDLHVKIPYIKQALELSKRPIQLFASPWGPPFWMKTNTNMSGQGTLIGKPGGKYYKTWAQYFVKFLEAYAKHNITFWGLTVENEPLEGMTPNYPFQCLGFTPELERDFIAQDLGPALKAAGFGDVKLMIIDDQRIVVPHWAKVILGDPAAAQYVSGIAVHWYTDLFFPTWFLSETHDAFPQYFILGTEACAGSSATPGPRKAVALGSWDRGESYAYDIIQDLLHWVSGWTDWNIALDMEGGPNWVSNFVDSPIIVNANKNEFYKQPMFYALGHFSKFLSPHSVRVGLIMNKPTSLESAAFITPDNQTVMIVLNRNETDQAFHVTDPQHGIINAIAPPRSILTLIW